MAEKELIVNEDWCKGCGMCVWICPFRVLRLSKEKINAMGYHPVEIAYPEKCVKCGLCEFVCPDFAIFLIEKEKIALHVGGRS